jgi:hypothetical protein
VGDYSAFPQHRRAAKAHGWTYVMGDDGKMQDVCPACNGTHPEFWQPWFRFPGQ